MRNVHAARDTLQTRASAHRDDGPSHWIVCIYIHVHIHVQYSLSSPCIYNTCFTALTISQNACLCVHGHTRESTLQHARFPIHRPMARAISSTWSSNNFFQHLIDFFIFHKKKQAVSLCSCNRMSQWMMYVKLFFSVYAKCIIYFDWARNELFYITLSVVATYDYSSIIIHQDIYNYAEITLMEMRIF